MKKLFIVGKTNHADFCWQFVGIFETKAEAEAACLDEWHFVGEATVGQAAPKEWPQFGCRYPNPA